MVMKTPIKVAETWDLAYQVRDIPWHSEHPPRELMRVLKEGGFKSFTVGVPPRRDVRPTKKVGLPRRRRARPQKIKVLDVGCGLGSSTIALAKTGYDVIGVDISKTAIEEARHRLREIGIRHVYNQLRNLRSTLRTAQTSFRTPNSAIRIGRIRFEVRDVFDLRPYYDKFDLVIDLGCLHCFDGKWRKAYLKEIHRVLKSDGLYWVMTFGRKAPDYGPYRYSQKEMRELTSPLFKTLFIRNADWSRLYQRRPSEIKSVSCLMKKM